MDLGARNKLMKVDNEADALICGSATIDKYSSANPNAAYVAHYESTSTLKVSKCQIKSFGATNSVDTIRDVYEFPDENIEVSNHGENSNQDHTKMFDDEISRSKFTE